MNTVVVVGSVVVGTVVGLIPAVILGMVLGLVPRPPLARLQPAGHPASSAPTPAPTPAPDGAEPQAAGPRAWAPTGVEPPSASPAREPVVAPRVRHRELYDAEYAKQLLRLEALRRTIGRRLSRTDDVPPAAQPEG
jgi:hypothetical protein